jgi:multicomponent Na+:H+ antiporter subunit D
MLYREGRGLWPVGIAMGLAGLLLGGLPVGLLHSATEIVQQPAAGIVVLSSALTGAAVLRATGRAFAGLSGVPGPEITAPTEREREKGNRPLWRMLLPCSARLLIALAPGELAKPFLGDAAANLIGLQPHDPLPALPTAGVTATYGPVLLTLGIVLSSILRQRPTRAISRRLYRLELLPFRILQFLHCGLIGDYVVWIIVGLAILIFAVQSA